MLISIMIFSHKSVDTWVDNFCFSFNPHVHEPQIIRPNDAGNRIVYPLPCWSHLQREHAFSWRQYFNMHLGFIIVKLLALTAWCTLQRSFTCLILVGSQHICEIGRKYHFGYRTIWLSGDGAETNLSFVSEII